MKEASLTNHAKQRISERCGISDEEVKQILDADGGILIHLQKGGRYAHRLIYSHKDDDWFMVVQDGGDGGVMTLMPLSFLKGRTEVTAAHKRQARSRANHIRKAIERTPATSQPAKFAAATIKPLPGWKIRVRYRAGTKSLTKSFPRTQPEHGDPADWLHPGLIHIWLKARLVEAGISIIAIDCILAEQKDRVETVNQLLEHLPLTPAELEACH